MASKIEMIRESKAFIYVGDFSRLDSIQEFTLEDESKSAFVSTTKQAFSKEFCWPIEVRDELIKIVGHRELIQAELDKSMSLVYKLNNTITNW